MRWQKCALAPCRLQCHHGTGCFLPVIPYHQLRWSLKHLPLPVFFKFAVNDYIRALGDLQMSAIEPTEGVKLTGQPSSLIQPFHLFMHFRIIQMQIEELVLTLTCKLTCCLVLFAAACSYSITACLDPYAICFLLSDVWLFFLCRYPMARSKLQKSVSSFIFSPSCC